MRLQLILQLFFQTVIKELNRLGMIIDLSHSSHKTALDAIQASEAPVIFSHSSAFALCNSTRNVHDDVLKLLVSNKRRSLASIFQSAPARERQKSRQQLS